MKAKVLFVDDDGNLLASLRRNLRNQYDLETAEGGEDGLSKIKTGGPFQVVISDRQMPGMDGIQFLATVRQQAPETVRIMLTGNADLEHAVRVVNEGNIFRFLIKPCPVEILSRAVDDALAQYRLVLAEKELLDKTLNGSIKMLTEILSLVDAASFGRSEKLGALITNLAPKMALANTWEIRLAGMLSPIGCVTLPWETIAKTRTKEALSHAEKQLIETVPGIAARLLSNIPRLEEVAKIVRYQQKHFDGGGFPYDDVKEEAIPIGARFLKILSDMQDLLAAGESSTAALDELSTRRGLYDPKLLDSIRTALGISSEKPVDALQTILIAVSDLAPGMVLHTDIRTKEGMMVLSAGHHINQMVLEKIQNFNLIYGIEEPIYVKSPQ